MQTLEELHILIKDSAYNENFRSPDRIKKAEKNHLVDPSLSCACLNLNSEKLINDPNLFGLMFEGLVERDLRIYADYLDGKLFHFSHNTLLIEVDAIIEFNDGNYAALVLVLSLD